MILLSDCLLCCLQHLFSSSLPFVPKLLDWIAPPRFKCFWGPWTWVLMKVPKFRAQMQAPSGSPLPGDLNSLLWPFLVLGALPTGNNSQMLFLSLPFFHNHPHQLSAQLTPVHCWTWGAPGPVQLVVENGPPSAATLRNRQRVGGREVLLLMRPKAGALEVPRGFSCAAGPAQAGFPSRARQLT